MAQADPARAVLWAATADWERPSAWPVAGRLLLTADRLLFTPRSGDEAWSTPLERIVDVVVTEWPPSMGRGRRRKRIRIETTDGSVELFAVATVSHAVDVIRVAVRAAGGDPSP